MEKTVVLGITGSIAAHKALELIDLLQKKSVTVDVIMTSAAAKMIDSKEIKKITKGRVYVDLFPENYDYKQILQTRKINHIELAKNADIFVIAPATANTIAKLAYGFADNFLTTTLLATTAPIIICPAMNTTMWENSITQKNITTLRTHGMSIIEPTVGMLACGDEGKGKLENVKQIIKEIENKINKRGLLKGKKILITAGGTKEKIDAIRFITNSSSGKMGAALAEVCFSQGADVLLLRAGHAVKPQLQIPEETFSTTEDLKKLLKHHIKHFDYIFHTAAIGDFSLKPLQEGKLSSDKKITLTLQPQEKLINFIKEINPHIYLIGFKAEYDLPKKELLRKALDKLTATGADSIIANDVGRKNSGFGSDKNDVYVIFPNGMHYHISHRLKMDVAEEIVNLIFVKK